MKLKKIILYILMFLPLPAVIVLLQLLPDRIPVHFNLSGEADHWGSKYETLIFPAVSIFAGVLTLIISRVLSKQERRGENNEKICLLSGILSLLIIDIVTFFFLYADITHSETLYTDSFDFYSLIFSVIGAVMVIWGYNLPKLRKNSVFGLPLSRTIESEEVWKKVHRFGGKCYIIGGLGTIAACVFVKGIDCLYVCVGINMIISVACRVYTVIAND